MDVLLLCCLPWDGPVFHLTDFPQCPSDIYFLNSELQQGRRTNNLRQKFKTKNNIGNLTNSVELIVTQAAKNFPIIYETQRLLIVFAATF